MLFVVLCNDKPGHLDLRLSTRPAHVEWLKGLEAEGVLKAAGPFLGEDGKPVGSMLILKAESIEAAQALAAQDPYAAAGLFADVAVRPWNWVFCNPEA